MTEKCLVKSCSQTLAGMKTGNIFSTTFKSEKDLRRIIRNINLKLSSKGVRVIPLRINNRKALIYTYRPSLLKSDLSDENVLKFLKAKGYSSDNPCLCIKQLMKNLKESDFPHEIGFFLGYPPEDVAGFIEKKECKCVGFWKVYGNEKEAEKTFNKYKKCRKIYMENFENGKTLYELTVKK